MNVWALLGLLLNLAIVLGLWMIEVRPRTVRGNKADTPGQRDGRSSSDGSPD